MTGTDDLLLSFAWLFMFLLGAAIALVINYLFAHQRPRTNRDATAGITHEQH